MEVNLDLEHDLYKKIEIKNKRALIILTQGSESFCQNDHRHAVSTFAHDVTLRIYNHIKNILQDIS